MFIYVVIQPPSTRLCKSKDGGAASVLQWKVFDKWSRQSNKLLSRLVRSEQVRWLPLSRLLPLQAIAVFVACALYYTCLLLRQCCPCASHSLMFDQPFPTLITVTFFAFWFDLLFSGIKMGSLIRGQQPSHNWSCILKVPIKLFTRPACPRTMLGITPVCWRTRPWCLYTPYILQFMVSYICFCSGSRCYVVQIPWK